MALHAHLQNEFTEDKKYHNLMRWLKCFISFSRRTPRIKSEEESGRKSRRFSTGMAPGKNKANNAAFLNQDDVCPAEDYKTRKMKMKE